MIEYKIIIFLKHLRIIIKTYKTVAIKIKNKFLAGFLASQRMR
jgi:hypothetical protein